jgi:hypothetical protein
MERIELVNKMKLILTQGAQRHSEKSPSSGDPVYRIGQVEDESAASHNSKYNLVTSKHEPFLNSATLFILIPPIYIHLCI